MDSPFSWDNGAYRYRNYPADATFPDEYFSTFGENRRVSQKKYLYRLHPPRGIAIFPSLIDTTLFVLGW